MLLPTVVAGLMTGLWLPAGGPQLPRAPEPPPENEVLKKSRGSWRCEGTAKTPDGKETRYTSSWSIEPRLGGHWFVMIYKRAGSGPIPALESNVTVGYSLAEKRYALAGFDDRGGWVELSSVEGSVFTGLGTPAGPANTVKYVFTAGQAGQAGQAQQGKETGRRLDVILDLGIAVLRESCKK